MRENLLAVMQRSQASEGIAFICFTIHVILLILFFLQHPLGHCAQVGSL